MRIEKTGNRFFSWIFFLLVANASLAGVMEDIQTSSSPDEYALSTYPLALLSKHVYSREEFVKTDDVGERRLPDGFFLSEEVSDYDPGDYDPGFDANVYLASPDIVCIAFGGTAAFSDPYDVLADLNLAQNKIPQQYQDGVVFAQSIQRKFPHSRIVLTGHSLGGGIAWYVGRKLDLDFVVFQPANLNRAMIERLPAIDSGASKRIQIGLRSSNPIVYSDLFEERDGELFFFQDLISSLNLANQQDFALIADAFWWKFVGGVVAARAGKLVALANDSLLSQTAEDHLIRSLPFFDRLLLENYLRGRFENERQRNNASNHFWQGIADAYLTSIDWDSLLTDDLLAYKTPDERLQYVVNTLGLNLDFPNTHPVVMSIPTGCALDYEIADSNDGFCHSIDRLIDYAEQIEMEIRREPLSNPFQSFARSNDLQSSMYDTRPSVFLIGDPQNTRWSEFGTNLSGILKEPVLHYEFRILSERWVLDAMNNLGLLNSVSRSIAVAESDNFVRPFDFNKVLQDRMGALQNHFRYALDPMVEQWRILEEKLLLAYLLREGNSKGIHLICEGAGASLLMNALSNANEYRFPVPNIETLIIFGSDYTQTSFCQKLSEVTKVADRVYTFYLWEYKKNSASDRRSTKSPNPPPTLCVTSIGQESLLKFKQISVGRRVEKSDIPLLGNIYYSARSLDPIVDLDQGIPESDYAIDVARLIMPAPTGTMLLVILDTSGSMDTNIGSGLTRFEVAQKRALEVLNQYGADDYFVLLVFDNNDVVIASEGPGTPGKMHAIQSVADQHANNGTPLFHAVELAIQKINDLSISTHDFHLTILSDGEATDASKQELEALLQVFKDNQTNLGFDPISGGVSRNHERP